MSRPAEPRTGPRVGQGFDAHRLVPGRRLVLGGVDVPHDRGLEGHSDGDALLHAVADAILGALGDGDLGTHFPSSDPALAGIDSSVIVSRVAERMRAAGLEVGNVDATVIAEKPRLASFLPEMKRTLAGLLGTAEADVNVKVTSTDGLGALGRADGIAALAVVVLR
jgi:2-C-methyl-D-erythritol 2,4-cyclodiphosphate synthase